MKKIILSCMLLLASINASEIKILTKELQNDKWIITYTYDKIYEFKDTKLVSNLVDINHTSIISPHESLPSVALFIVDTSKSMKTSFVYGIKETIEEIFLSKQPWDYWAIAGFDKDLEIFGDFNQSTPDDALSKIVIKGLRTELFRASYNSIKKLSKYKNKRKFLLIFSDGEAEDTSAYSDDDVLEEARKNNVTILSFCYRDTIHIQNMRKLAEETEGMLWEANKQTNKLDSNYKAELFSYFNNSGMISFDAALLTANEVGEQKIDLILSNDSNNTKKVTITFPVEKLEPVVEEVKPIEPIIIHERSEPIIIKQETQSKDLKYYIIGFGLSILSGLLYLLFRPKKEKQVEEIIEEEIVIEKKDPIAYFQTVSGAKKYVYDKSTTIGALNDNDIVIEGEFMSRHHAILDKKDEKFFIIDHNSLNGVSVNSKAIKNEEIKDGDIVSFGPFETTFKIIENDIDYVEDDDTEI